MESWLEILKIVGGLAGLLALIWRVFDEFGSHLRISVKAEGPKDGWITILTVVDNKGNRPKDISYAALLIGPESELPLKTAELLTRRAEYGGPLQFTNDLANFVVEHPVYGEGRCWIPLRFYYQENVDVADETLTYRLALPVEKFQSGIAYSVRFFLFPKGRLHRSTQDCFVVP